MSWGYRIIIVYVLFIIMMLGMVYVASKQTNEMQDKNYYAKELAYQSVIDGKNNLNALPEKLTITNTYEAVVIKVPEAAASAISNGTIYFLRPSGEKSDVHSILMPDSKSEQSIPKSKFEKGIYTVQINWKSNSKIYYYEQKFQVE